MHLLIAAAGSGSRMGADRNKLLLKVAGKTVLEWTLKAAFDSKTISWIGIIGQPKDKNSICSILDNSVKVSSMDQWRINKTAVSSTGISCPS